MKAKLIHPGHVLWPAWCNQVHPGYNYTVMIFSDLDTDQEFPLDLVDTYTEMAARTVMDAVNLSIVTDWRKLYG